MFTTISNVVKTIAGAIFDFYNKALDIVAGLFDDFEAAVADGKTKETFVAAVSIAAMFIYLNPIILAALVIDLFWLGVGCLIADVIFLGMLSVVCGGLMTAFSSNVKVTKSNFTKASDEAQA